MIIKREVEGVFELFSDGHQKVSVTRYMSERWAETASDVLCGAVDDYDDVGVCIFANGVDFREDRFEDRFVIAIAGQELPCYAPDCYVASSGQISVFIPTCREMIEQVIEMTLPVVRQDTGAIEHLGFAFAFNGWSALNALLPTLSAEAVIQRCSDLHAKALVEIRYFWGEWTVTPRRIPAFEVSQAIDRVLRVLLLSNPMQDCIVI